MTDVHSFRQVVHQGVDASRKGHIQRRFREREATEIVNVLMLRPAMSTVFN